MTVIVILINNVYIAMYIVTVALSPIQSGLTP